jgi:hypothetical protein
MVGRALGWRWRVTTTAVGATVITALVAGGMLALLG